MRAPGVGRLRRRVSGWVGAGVGSGLGRGGGRVSKHRQYQQTSGSACRACAEGAAGWACSTRRATASRGTARGRHSASRHPGHAAVHISRDCDRRPTRSPRGEESVGKPGVARLTSAPGSQAVIKVGKSSPHRSRGGKATEGEQKKERCGAPPVPLCRSVWGTMGAVAGSAVTARAVSTGASWEPGSSSWGVLLLRAREEAAWTRAGTVERHSMVRADLNLGQLIALFVYTDSLTRRRCRACLKKVALAVFLSRPTPKLCSEAPSSAVMFWAASSAPYDVRGGQRGGAGRGGIGEPGQVGGVLAPLRRTLSWRATALRCGSPDSRGTGGPGAGPRGQPSLANSTSQPSS